MFLLVVSVGTLHFLSVCFKNSSLFSIGRTSLKAASFTLLLSTMSPTNSFPYGLIRASSLKAAAFPNCAMCNAQPSLLVKVGTSFVAASFDLCAMCHTDSSVHNLICTSLAATSLDLCSMRDADSSPDDFFSTPHETTSFHLHHCTMRDTNPSSNGPVCTSVQAVHGFTFLILVLISDRDFLATDLSFSPCIFFLL